LQIHHGAYRRGAMPWEYPEGVLFCLCDSCHERAEAVKNRAHWELGLIHPAYQEYAVTLLRELQRAIARGVATPDLQALTLERGV
jgi:hypothetical protein